MGAIASIQRGPSALRGLTCSFLTACVRVMYRAALPTFLRVLPMELRFLNFFFCLMFARRAARAFAASPAFAI